jgi:hypothetical protein
MEIVETRIGRRNKVKTIVGSTLIFALLLASYFINREHNNELKRHGRYTIATTLKFTLTAKSGRGVAYEFYFNDIRYSGVSDYLYEAKVPNGRYLLKFSYEDPSINEIYLNQPIPEDIVSPTSGWKSIRDIN